MRAARDQHDRVTRLVEAGADHSSDGARSVNDETGQDPKVYIIPMPPIPPMPPMPPPPGGIIGAGGSGLSATRHSVVSSNEAIDAAFCNAARVTLAGSMTPAFMRSSYSP